VSGRFASCSKSIRRALAMVTNSARYATFFACRSYSLQVAGGRVKTLIQDIRYGLRMLFKQPGFFRGRRLCFRWGLAAVPHVQHRERFLLKPLLIQKADEIVGCYTGTRSSRIPTGAFSYPNYADLRANNASRSLMAHNLALVGFAEGDTTRRVFSDIVSANYFATAGAPLFRGGHSRLTRNNPAARFPA